VIDGRSLHHGAAPITERPDATRTWLFAVMPWTTRRLRSAWHDELGIAFRSARSSALSSMAAELLDVHLTTAERWAALSNGTVSYVVARRHDERAAKT
jgi:hypothetical protein